MHHFVFGILPYIAITVMILGSIARYERDPFTWKTKSSQLLRKRQFVIGSVLFHVGVLVILMGHVAGLLVPKELYYALGVTSGTKQVIAITVGGLAGVAALIGGLILLHRRLTDPRIRANSSFGDNAVMILLVAQLVLGLATIPLALGHLDGSEMLKFMAWAQGLITFKAGAAAHVADVHPIFKLHILLGLGLFIAVPFTRLVHIGSAPLRYLWRPGYQIVRSRRGARPVAPLAPFAAPVAAGRAAPAPQPSPVPQRQAAE